MPFDISFESNLRDWTADLNRFQREHVPFATVMALTWTAKDVAEEHRRALPSIFDRPTRWTMNSLQVTPANKTTMRSSVWFKDSAGSRRHYLVPQVEGGVRPQKRFEQWLVRKGVMGPNEFAVPARGLRLDAFGNLPGSVITQILSQLAAGPDAFQWETARSRKRAGASRARYFASSGKGLPRGIWRRKGATLEPVLMFVSGVDYDIRYRFEGISRIAAERRMPINFARAMDRAISMARQRSITALAA